MTPAAARERHGVLPPREEYARFRALVTEKLDARDDAVATDAAVVAASKADEFEGVLGPVG